MVSVSLVFSFPASVKIPDAARYLWRVNTVDALAMAKSRSWNITSGTTTHLHNTGCRIFGDPLCYDWRLTDGLIRLLASFHAAPWGEKRTMIWWLGLARCYLTNPSANSHTMIARQWGADDWQVFTRPAGHGCGLGDWATARRNLLLHTDR